MHPACALIYRRSVFVLTSTASCWLGVLLCAFALASELRAASVSDFVDFSLSKNNQVVLPGRLYVPPAAVADPATPRPLILFFHGAGEIGTNNLNQIGTNIDTLLAGAKAHQSYLYAPQMTSQWDSSVTAMVNMMLTRAASDYNADLQRMYITGASRGGGGVWSMLSQFPERFAAAVPVCANPPDASFFAGNLTDQAVWAFHARNDPTVGVAWSRTTVGKILNAAHQPALTFPPLSDATTTFDFASSAIDLRYTEWPTGGHDIWNRVYSDEAVYDWLFNHPMPVPEPKGIALAIVALAGLLLYSRRLAARHRAAGYSGKTSTSPPARVTRAS